MEHHLLSLTIWIPILGALLVTIAPKSATKAIAAVASLAAMIASIVVALHFTPVAPPNPDLPGFQMTEKHLWIALGTTGPEKTPYGIEYLLGVDGISITMVLLTGVLSFICILASWGFEHWNTNKGIKGYFALFLLLEAGMMGVFESLDFFLFYVFWEMMLLPMYFLIGIWGGPRREYAAIKFFLYTLAGSVFMLVVMLAMYFSYDADPASPGRQGTFNLVTLATHGPAIFTGFWWKMAFLGLYVGFAIKVPVFPFHTWLPDAHVEAPTPISVILAGVLLKMGTYGLMRISYPLLPEAALWFAPFMMAFGTWNIIYGSLCAMAQIRGVPRVNPQTGEKIIERDLKKMIAYSSVAHMGFCLLGLAACNPAGLSGCLFQMWNHGIITSMLFLLVGVVYDRAHHRNIDGFGGLWSQMPQYGALTAMAFMASLGLPGLSGFVSEFLSFAGGFQAGSTYPFEFFGHSVESQLWFKVLTSISVGGVVLGAGYFLWSYQKVFQGPLNPKYANLKDMNVLEMVTIWPLAISSVILGVYPSFYLNVIMPSINALSEHMQMPWVTGR
jgi:NADH-quinone oxidoreductase subunit M